MGMTLNCSEENKHNHSFEHQLKEALTTFYQGDFYPLADLVMANIEELPEYFTNNKSQRLSLTQIYIVEYVRKEVNPKGELVFWFNINEREVAIPVTQELPHTLMMSTNCLFIDLLQEERKLRYEISKTIANPINPAVVFWNGSCSYVTPEDKYDFEKETSPEFINSNIKKYEPLAKKGDTVAILRLTIFLNDKLSYDSVSKKEFKTTLKKLIYWYKECGQYNVYCIQEQIRLLEKGIATKKMLGADKRNLLHQIYNLDPCHPGYLELLEIYTYDKQSNKNLELAKELKKTAITCAETNSQMAIVIGTYYQYGMFGFKVDKCRAIKYFEKAIKLGKNDHLLSYYKLKEEVNCQN